MSATGRSDKPTIILIHGLWLTPRSFERWIDRFERAGYNVMAPPWPGLEGEVEELRRNPAPLKGLKLARVVDHYVKIITKLPRPPILMGHSTADSARRASVLMQPPQPEFSSFHSLKSARRSRSSEIHFHSTRRSC